MWFKMSTHETHVSRNLYVVPKDGCLELEGNKPLF